MGGRQIGAAGGGREPWGIAQAMGVVGSCGGGRDPGGWQGATGVVESCGGWHELQGVGGVGAAGQESMGVAGSYGGCMSHGVAGSRQESGRSRRAMQTMWSGGEL